MSRLRTHARRWAGRPLAGLGVVALVVSFLVPATARPARADVSIDAAGSTWVQIALDQWAADVARQGLSINYQGVGSTSGRVFYYQDQVDFAASEIPFTAAYKDATGTVSTNEVALAAHRPYAYMPDVAGGTSFMYHLDIAGNRVTNLQLSPTNLAKIFTGVITNWNDPALAADNPQLHLPSLPIRPVVRSDGSGTTAQFTAFMASQTPALWNAFCQRVGYNQNPCPSVSLWPDINATQQQFSDGVADYVAAPYNNGAITYVEYGYAKQRGFPVASILNHAGYYTQPTPNAVAIALQGATLNADLTQNLGGVYAFPDPRAYPVSSYSYMIVPTTTASPFTTDKGVTLSKFILYLVCAGQQEAALLGYSPLPKNLVQDAFDVVTKIPGHVNPPPIGQCDNPTITGAFVTNNAPPPPASAKQGFTPPESQNGNGSTGGSGGQSGGGLTGGGGLSGTGARNRIGSVASAKGATGKAGAATTGASAAGQLSDASPDQGLVVASGPISVPPPRDPLPLLLYTVAAVVALLAVFGPPALFLQLRRRRSPVAPPPTE
jgi:phosphate transport system substrate-binding protein